MLQYAVFAAAGVLLSLAALKVWAGRSTVSARPSAADEDIRAAWDDVDRYVRGADVWWPHLRSSPYVISGCITSCIMVAFAAAGGWSLGGGSWFHGALMVCVFSVVNIAQAVIAITGDRGTASFWEGAPTDRSAVSWFLLILLLVLNLFGAFVGSATIGSQMSGRSTIEAGKLSGLVKERKAAEDERALLNQRRMASGGKSAEALDKEATDKEREAAREEQRSKTGKPVCGPLCEGLSRQATQLRSAANDAAREARLGERIQEINKQLTGTDGGTEDNPSGRRIAELTGGGISAETFDRWAVMILQWIMALVDLGLWLVAGDKIGAARAAEFGRRAEKGNRELINRNLSARYAITPAVMALPAPAAKQGDTVVLSLAEDVVGKIKASGELSDIDALFAELMAAEDGRRVSFGVLYSVYSERRKAGGAEYMSSVAFFAALKRYCDLKAISVQSSELVGWKLAVAKAAE